MSITYHKYSEKLNGEKHPCIVCGWEHYNKETKKGLVVQHHVAGRRYDDRCIWVCYKCHAKIHNPTSFGLPASWAYDNFYLLHRNKTMQNKKKSKSCSHASSYFDARLGYIKCQFCGQKVESINFGVKRASKSIQREKVSQKMGFDDKQPPHIIEAADLKTKSDKLKVLMKRTKDVIEHRRLRIEFLHTSNRMQELAREYNLE